MSKERNTDRTRGKPGLTEGTQATGDPAEELLDYTDDMLALLDTDMRYRAVNAAFMHMFGHVCLGLMWAQMAKVSYEALENGAADPTFYETKITTGRYYMARRLPATSLHLARINSGADTVMKLDAANF